MTEQQPFRIWPRLDGAEREAFLKERRIAVLCVARTRGGPVAVPVWYEYRAGEFWIDTLPDSLHGRLMQRTGRATVMVQSEEAPQRYVTAEGPVAFLSGADLEALGETREAASRRIAGRYMEPAQADRYVVSVAAAFNFQIAVLTPETVWAAVMPELDEVLGD